MNKFFAMLAILAGISGCAAVNDTVTALRGQPTAEQTQLALEREKTRRYNLCMKQSLGRFGSFASPESRRKAAETCQPLIDASTAG